MAEQKYEPVTFLDSAGNVISNDPIYLAQQQLAAAGLINPQYTPVKELDSDDTEMDDDDSVDYSQLNGRELKALAKDRGVDITGLKTVGQVRDALREADEAAAKSDEQSDEDDEEK